MGRTKSPSAASTARTGDRGKPAKSDCQGRNREPPSRNCNYCKCRERLPARVRRNSARIRREGKTSQAYGASSARTRAQSRTARRAARMRNEDGMGGRRAGCMGDSESERLCRHRRSQAIPDIRSALPCVIASFPVAPAVRNAWKVTTSGRPALVSTPAAAHAARASCTPRSCACTPRCSNAVASGAFSPHLRCAKGREQK